MRQDVTRFGGPRECLIGLASATAPLHSEGIKSIKKIFVNPGPKYGKIIHDFGYFMNMN